MLSAAIRQPPAAAAERPIVTFERSIGGVFASPKPEWSPLTRSSVRCLKYSAKISSAAFSAAVVGGVGHRPAVGGGFDSGGRLDELAADLIEAFQFCGFLVGDSRV